MEQVQFSPFTELLTEGFDNDQIWEEIASQNEPFLDYAKTALKEFTKKPSTQKQSFTDDDEESLSGQSMDLDQAQDDEEDAEEHGLDFMDQDAETDQEEDDEEMQEHGSDDDSEDDEAIDPEVVETPKR